MIAKFIVYYFKLKHIKYVGGFDTLNLRKFVDEYFAPTRNGGRYLVILGLKFIFKKCLY